MTLFIVYFTVTDIHPNGYECGSNPFSNYVRAESVEQAIALTKERLDVGTAPGWGARYHSFRGEVCKGRSY